MSEMKLGFVLVVDGNKGLKRYPWTDEIADKFGFDAEDRIALDEGSTVFLNDSAFYIEEENIEE